MKIHVLIEDETASEALTAEHGLALYIERGGAQILFDAGATGKFMENAGKMGVSLAAADFAVVSHGHYDHAGGLMDFLSLNRTAPAYMKPEAAEEQYAMQDGGEKHFVGADPRLFEQFGGRVRFVSRNRELLPGCHLVCELLSDPAHRNLDGALYTVKGGRLSPDDFEHELMLVFTDTDGLVLITGCSHSGVVNLLDTARRAFPGRPVKALAGGLHLFGGTLDSLNCDERHIAAVAEKLSACGRIYAGHCTGRAAFALLKEKLGDKLQPLNTGMVITV